jgi:hypothetical protein
MEIPKILRCNVGLPECSQVIIPQTHCAGPSEPRISLAAVPVRGRSNGLRACDLESISKLSWRRPLKAQRLSLWKVH